MFINVPSGKFLLIGVVVISVKSGLGVGVEVVCSGLAGALPSFVLFAIAAIRNSSQAVFDWHRIGFCAGTTSPQSALHCT